MLLVYAISGIALNHKDTYNSQFTIERKTFRVSNPIPQTSINKALVLKWLLPLDESDNYTKHYFPEHDILKVFLKGGSNVVIDLRTGEGIFESVKKRPVIGALSRLHYNPSKAWTLFADVFAVALLLIIVSGLFMLRGRHGLWGLGGIELLLGILIPLIFMLI